MPNTLRGTISDKLRHTQPAQAISQILDTSSMLQDYFWSSRLTSAAGGNTETDVTIPPGRSVLFKTCYCVQSAGAVAVNVVIQLQQDGQALNYLLNSSVVPTGILTSPKDVVGLILSNPSAKDAIALRITAIGTGVQVTTFDVTITGLLLPPGLGIRVA
jgi:hypothetical protein